MKLIWEINVNFDKKFINNNSLNNILRGPCHHLIQEEGSVVDKPTNAFSARQSWLFSFACMQPMQLNCATEHNELSLHL